MLHTISEKSLTMVQITGKYKRTSEKSYEDFLSKLGLNFMIRKAATSSIPTMEIIKCGDKWKIVTATKLRNVLLEFEMVRFNFEELYQKTISMALFI